MASQITERITVNTAQSTIALDFAQSKNKMFVGNAVFSGAKTISFAQDTNALSMVIELSVTTSASITFPASVISTDTRLSSNVLTLTGTALYEISGNFDGTSWHVNVSADGGTISSTGVSSVSGTSNRVTSSGGSTPVIDISASYVGQASITTVGALASGSLAAGFTAIGSALGGTGVANNAASTLTISGNFATTLTVSGITGVTLPTSGTLATTAQDWHLASGGALTGANTVTGTTTNTLKFVFDNLAAVRTNGAGVWLANTTAATDGGGSNITTNQQCGPSFVSEGQGYKTDAIAGSQSVKYAGYTQPYQSTANPYGRFRIVYSINAAADTEQLALSSLGTMFLGTALSFGTVSTPAIASQAAASLDLYVNGGSFFASSGTKLFSVGSTNAGVYSTVSNYSLVKIGYPATMTAGGTTGNQTIDKPSGSVNIVAGGSTITVTNNTVLSTSIVLAVVMTADATAILKNVVVSAGSFVITTTAAVTAETKIGFLVIN